MYSTVPDYGQGYGDNHPPTAAGPGPAAPGAEWGAPALGPNGIGPGPMQVPNDMMGGFQVQMGGVPMQPQQLQQQLQYQHQLQHQQQQQFLDDPRADSPVPPYEDLSNLTTHTFFSTQFDITNRYVDLKPVGMGAFGLVCSAADTLTGQAVAVKKIIKPFDNQVLAKRTYRELKLLKHLKHENVISMTDIFLTPSNDTYFITELLGTDLHRLLSAHTLKPEFIQYFVYQILRGLKYVHSAGIIHRDLKPSNILVNENCDLKICDFGLARIQDPQMTGYVSTRYYRAPEIMLTWQRYDVEIDVWSTGCIFAEMFQGEPIFPGNDHVHQFTIITELLGSPDEDVVKSICSENTLRFVTSLPHTERQSFTKRFTKAPPEAIALLEKMLVFDPKKRIRADEALEDPYLSEYHDPSDEPVASEKFDWSFNDADLSVEVWKGKIFGEVDDFHRNDPMRGSA